MHAYCKHLRSDLSRRLFHVQLSTTTSSQALSGLPALQSGLQTETPALRLEALRLAQYGGDAEKRQTCRGLEEISVSLPLLRRNAQQQKSNMKF